ncbi:hypothetical protein BDZ91DRAFT_844929 [Kalaharituber pfeilii]|nr:hypothetical protein BDZ91DRAFT_844929 [Kalaharituber pfeilii]
MPNNISFYSLPAETLLQVYANLSSFTDVLALAIVSKRLWGVFIESRVAIFKAVAAQAHDLSTSGRQLIRAMALRVAFESLPRPEQTPVAYAIVLASFIRSEVFNPDKPSLLPTPAPFTLEEVDQLVYIWRVANALEPVILERVQVSKELLQKRSLWKEHYQIPTHVEWRDRIRIHNAIYRMWCYQILFYRTPYDPTVRPTPVKGAGGHGPGFETAVEHSADCVFLLSGTMSDEGLELAEFLALWTSLISGRFFPRDRFHLAVDVALGDIALRDEQGNLWAEARGEGRISFKRDLGESNLRVQEMKVSKEIISTVTLINQWSPSKWTMSRSQTRISAFKKGLARILTPSDALLFVSRTAVPFREIRQLGQLVKRRFSDLAVPATGRGLMEQRMNRWYKLPTYYAWGSFLFMLEGTEGRFCRPRSTGNRQTWDVTNMADIKCRVKDGKCVYETEIERTS